MSRVMIEDPAKSPLFGAVPVDPGREGALWGATWAGLVLCLVGLIDGVVVALQRKVIPCPDGTYFPKGTTDTACYVHPQAGVGIAIAVLSIVLGIVVVFTSIVAEASLRERQHSH